MWHWHLYQWLNMTKKVLLHIFSVDDTTDKATAINDADASAHNVK